MRRFIQRVVLTMLLVIAALLLLHVLTALSTFKTRRAEQVFFGLKNEWGSTYLRVHDFERWLNVAHDKPTGLILGTSTAYRNIDPDILEQHTGMSWFNAGSLSQHPGISMTLLEYAISIQKPDYVLLDIYDELFNAKSKEAAYDWIINGENNDISRLLLSDNPDFRMVNEYLYRLLKRKMGGKQYYNLYPLNGTYHSNGFVCSDQHSPLQAYTRKSEPFDLSRQPGMNRLNEIAALCKANNIRLLINIAPVLLQSVIIDQSIRNDYTIIDNSRFTREDMIGLFFDSHHMTCAGSSVYSDSLGRKIALILSP